MSMRPAGLERLARQRYHSHLGRVIHGSPPSLSEVVASSAPEPAPAPTGFFPLLSRGSLSLEHIGNGDKGNHDGIHLSVTAYDATHTFLIICLIAFTLCLLSTLPYAIIRIKHSSTWFQGFILRKTCQQEQEEKKRLTILAPVHRRALRNNPPLLPHLVNPIPTYRIPWINLTITQFLWVAGLWITAAVGAWVDADFVWEGSRSAFVVLVLMVLLVLLAAKAGGLGTILGCGYASLNFLHRWTGRLVFFITTLHVLQYLVLFLQRGIFKHEMSLKPNILATMAYGGLCLVGIVSIGAIRRRWWVLFKIGHHIGIIIMLGGLNYHSKASMPYIVALFAILGLNSTVRMLTTGFHRATLTVLPGAGTTLVTLPLTSGFYPGQHLRIRVWSSNRKMGFAGWLEAHPFSIASAPGPESEVRLLVKKAGDWTTGLYVLAQAGQSVRRGEKWETVERRVLVTVEGPYGGPLNFLFPSYQAVMVCAGGSGVSFALSVAEGMVRGVKRGVAACRNLVFVWTVRDRANLEALYPLLQSLIDEAESLEYVCPDFTLTLELYFTAKNTSSVQSLTSKHDHLALETHSSSTVVSVNNRRPDFKALLHRLALDITPRGGENGGGVGVGACGPSVLVDGLENVVREMSTSSAGRRAGGVVMHSESFSL